MGAARNKTWTADATYGSGRAGRDGWWRAALPLMLLAMAPGAATAQMTADAAWKALPQYQHGQEMTPLLALDREVTRAMASAESRAACAARLAALAEDAAATTAARQFACLKLRHVGTSAEVPALVRLLKNKELAEDALAALATIDGPAAAAALRAALDTLHGSLLVGAINAAGSRRDAGAVPRLGQLAGDADRKVAEAAIRALGNVANEAAADLLAARAEKSAAPLPPTLAAALLQCADGFAAGAQQRAKAICTHLDQPGQAAGVRRAALEGLFRLEPDRAAAVLAWLADADPARRRIAAGHLASLADRQLEELAGRLATLPAETAVPVLEALAARPGAARLRPLLAAAQSDNRALRLLGVRGLARVADPATLPLLVDRLGEDEELAGAAADAICGLARAAVIPPLLSAIAERPQQRVRAIEILARMHCSEAIDPLVALAAHEEPEMYEAALEGLWRIADPDKEDLSRLLALLEKTPAGRRRDAVEKTIMRVCAKTPPGTDRAAAVVDVLGQGATASPRVLPLLGRLGGPRALAAVEASLSQSDPEVRPAALRALCNWPDATVAPRLLELAAKEEDPAWRRTALAAYVRVVTLQSDRPEAQTLAMLQQAMAKAEESQTRRWVIARASTVRTMAAVDWIAGYLDDPELAQAACLSIVELAHHRFLRHPNMDRFGPLLDRVSRQSGDAAVVERAKKYRLGL